MKPTNQPKPIQTDQVLVRFKSLIGSILVDIYPKPTSSRNFQLKLCLNLVGSDIGHENSNRGENVIVHKRDIIQDESELRYESDVVQGKSDVVQNERDVQGKIDVAQLLTNSGLQIPIMKYYVNDWDKV